MPVPPLPPYRAWCLLALLVAICHRGVLSQVPDPTTSVPADGLTALPSKSKPTLAFFTGYVKLFTDDGKNLREPLYGSEITLLKLAETFRPDYDITIITDSLFQPQEQVEWLRHISLTTAIKDLEAGKRFDVLVVSRYINYFIHVDARAMANKTFLWLHDIVPLSWWYQHHLPDNGCPLLTNVMHRIDGIVVLTHWHRSYVMTTCRIQPDSPEAGKVKVIGHGVDDIDPFSAIPRAKDRFIWVAAHERGLSYMLSIFPRIRAMMPDAELHVFRQVADPEIPQDVQGVVFRGFANHSLLQEEMSQADYWLYPTGFHETYCLSALEAQRAGCIAIASNLGALSETVSPHATLLDQPPYTPEATEEVLRVLHEIDADPVRKQLMRERSQEWASEQTWPAKAREWVTLFQKPALPDPEGGLLQGVWPIQASL